MATTIAKFLTSLPTNWKALTALGGAVALGVAIGAVAVDMRGLPAQVRTVRDSVATVSRRVEVNTVTLQRIDRQYARIICLLTLPEDVRVRVAANPVLLERECP